MRIYAFKEPLRYGVLLFNIVGDPVQDRPHCANTIKEAHKIALDDMKKQSFSCATIYTLKKGDVVQVRNVTPAGKIEKIQK